MSFVENLFGLKDKIAIVTGASRGLGRAAAIALSSAGAKIVLVGRDVDALKETLALLPTHGSLIIETDVTNDDDRTRCIELALKTFGRIDILINNAGIIRRSPAVSYTTEDWNSVLDTNLTATFHWAQDVGVEMIRSGGGKIVNIASLLSFGGGMNVVAYAAAKGGVAQLTKALANEWAKKNVNVNAIAPGYFVTNATEALRQDSDRSAQILARIPAGRWGSPEDLMGAFVFLCSDASQYMHGHILAVDGGYLSL
jgi:2-deoxy-D-gluconate 3-dehydrogenase